jgi:hypothetical protein
MLAPGGESSRLRPIFWLPSVIRVHGCCKCGEEEEVEEEEESSEAEGGRCYCSRYSMLQVRLTRGMGRYAGSMNDIKRYGYLRHNPQAAARDQRAEGRFRSEGGPGRTEGASYERRLDEEQWTIAISGERRTWPLLIAHCSFAPIVIRAAEIAIR